MGWFIIWSLMSSSVVVMQTNKSLMEIKLMLVSQAQYHRRLCFFQPLNHNTSRDKSSYGNSSCGESLFHLINYKSVSAGQHMVPWLPRYLLGRVISFYTRHSFPYILLNTGKPLLSPHNLSFLYTVSVTVNNLHPLVFLFVCVGDTPLIFSLTRSLSSMYFTDIWKRVPFIIFSVNLLFYFTSLIVFFFCIQE